MKTPTTEEFIKEYLDASDEFMESMIDQLNDCSGFDFNNITDLMIEFTKYHLKNQANAIYNIGLSNLTTWYGNPYNGEGSESLDIDKILNAYPLENIK